jgi:four helix bundle protein
VVASSFRDLKAYRCAYALARDMHEATLRWQAFDQWSVGIQLVRAADSVAANIAEACGRWHYQDRARVLLLARGSLYETEHWITSAEDRGLLEPGTSHRIDEIARLLNGLIKKQRQA